VKTPDGSSKVRK